MPVSAAAKRTKLIVDQGLSPLLKQSGFRKDSTHYWRYEGEALQVINVQSSQWNTASSARFTLNIGVHFSSVAKMLYGKDPMPATPKEYYRLLRGRIGSLMPAARDHWWIVTSETDIAASAAELAAACKEYVFPWLEKVKSVSGAADEMEKSKLMGLWNAAAARLVLGERERVAQLVAAAIEAYKTDADATHPANAELTAKRIAELLQWAASHGLEGFSKP
jgi:Domain of unknown function (DUF4304)